MRESKHTKELLLEQLKKTPIVQIACEKVGLSRVSFYNWKKKDPEFATQVDEAVLEGCSLVNDLAESQLIGAVKEGNIQGIAYWLKHHHPTYKNKLDITARLDKEEALTPEQEASVREALRLAFGSVPVSEDITTNQNNHEEPKQQ